MLMVIFGAGASHDSTPNPPASTHYKPPLANALFENRDHFRKASQLFPACQGIIPMLQRRPPNVSVEDRLAELQAEDPVRRAPHIAAVRLYLRQIIYSCERVWIDHAGGIRITGLC